MLVEDTSLDDHFHDQCGVVAIVDQPEAAQLAYLGLYALQHRGQEGAGISTLDEDGKLSVHKKKGLVSEVFEPRHFKRVPGRHAIGHVRYSTQGGNVSENLQPISVVSKYGPLSVAHNGNIPHADTLRTSLQKEGVIFQTTSDTELLIHLMSRSAAATLEEALIESLRRLEAAFSIVLLTAKGIYAVRDPFGFRPLLLGKEGAHWMVASETCAFDLMGARLEREVAPGELVFLGFDGSVRSMKPFSSHPEKRCVFEWVYFSRPDSVAGPSSIHETRVRLGMKLAEEAPAPGADMTIPVPDSGVSAAIGYARQSGVPFEMGIIRNHYVHRTFIQPRQEVRSTGVRIKLNPVEALIRGKSIVVVDDSIVRGTTSRKLVQLMREAGAREVHMRISSPPVTGPCFFGIDTPRKEDLIASNHSVEEIRAFIGADSLEYLSVEGMTTAVNPTHPRSFCDACFTGNYPLIAPRT